MRVRAAGLAFSQDKLLLLTYDYPAGRVYAVPGGGLHPGETAAEAVCREYREELKMEVEVGVLRYVAEMMAQPTIPQTLHLIFEVRIGGSQPRLNPMATSANEFGWFDFDLLAELKIYPDVAEALIEDLSNGTNACRYLGNSMRRVWI